MTAPQPPAAGASRSPAPGGQEAEHVTSREAVDRGGSWVSAAVYERTRAALARAQAEREEIRRAFDGFRDTLGAAITQATEEGDEMLTTHLTVLATSLRDAAGPIYRALARDAQEAGDV